MKKKKDSAYKIMEHESFKAFLHKYIISNKGSEKALQALSSMQKAYVTLTSARQGQNSLFNNVLVTKMVSNAVNTSQ
jgi:hypothetical protein